MNNSFAIAPLGGQINIEVAAIAEGATDGATWNLGAGAGSGSINGSRGGWGVPGGSGNFNVRNGEGFVFTFTFSDGFALPALTALQLTGFGWQNNATTGLFYQRDSSVTVGNPGAGVLLSSTNANAGSLGISLSDGDSFLLYNPLASSSSRFQNLTLEVVAVPETSSYALIGGLFAIGGIALRRRRG